MAASIEHHQLPLPRIDGNLQRANHDTPAQRLAVLPAIREDLAAIRTLMTLLFERIGELDAGSDALTNLLNRRFTEAMDEVKTIMSRKG